MIIKRVQPMSLAKIMGVVYAVLGFFFGILCSVVGLASSTFLPGPQQSFQSWSLFFGVGAIVFLPILYGLLGFLGGLFSAAIYNALAKWIGGVVIDVE